MLEIQNVSKTYKHNILALDNISFRVGANEIFALIGLNGAGKSTLIKCVLNLLRPESGRILFKNTPLTFKQIHSSIGYLPEYFSPYPELNSYDWCRCFSSDGPAINRALEKVNLAQHCGKRIKEFSKGMVQRLGIASFLIKECEFVILDEPFGGLDVMGQKEIMDLICGLRQDGKTVFFSSHIFSHVERIATCAGIIHKGELRFCGKIEEFKQKRKAETLEDAFLQDISI